MKKFNILLALLASTCLFFTACDKDDNGKDGTPPSEITGVVVTPDYGGLNFSWDTPQDEELLYVDITYENSKGEFRSMKTSSFAQKTTIEGFSDTNEYTFSIVAYDESGNSSNAQEVKGSPNTPPSLLVIKTIEVAPAFGGVKFTWSNITGKEVKVKVDYQKEDQEINSTSFKAEEVSGEVVIPELDNVPYTFSVIVVDAWGNESDSKTLAATPLLVKKIGKENWKVIDFSSEEPKEATWGPAIQGSAAAAIDDDVSTFWHSAWNSSSPDFPHYFTVDMGKEVTISSFECFRRQGVGSGHTQQKFEVSTDNLTWIDLGISDFDNQTNDGQTTAVPSNPKVRYFRYTATEGPNNFTHLGEINVYGAE